MKAALKPVFKGTDLVSPSPLTPARVVTDEHPFWVSSEKRWSNAVDLKAAHRLETGDHRDATVTGTRSWSETRRVYNLTVDTDHTYYVVAGQTPVLTHNCGREARAVAQSASADATMSAAARFRSTDMVSIG
ncbi:polymorphic toxin-type HINT domain-containing protein [Amycolatopsis japonica]|uniref:polymorphic toxin-type HINT domain-containing protein n=1 Tax=Amycolatopsis japonica TaxID=208439 RepID=UPI0033219F93